MDPRLRGDERGWGRLARRALVALNVLAAAALLLWTAAANGRPPVFTDTAYYFTLGEYASELAGLVPGGEARVAAADPSRIRHDGPGGRPSQASTIMGARAPSYALFLYGTQRLGGLWLTAALQAWAMAWTVWLLARGVEPLRSLAAFWALSAALAATSTLPYVTSFAMPDVFGGVTAAGIVALLVWWDRYGAGERAGLAALLLFAFTTHGSHPAVALVMGGAGAVVLWLFGAGRGRALARGGLVIGLALASLAVGAAGEAWLDRAGSIPLLRPPFLTARLVADGSGRTYLHTACRDPAAKGGAAYRLCAHAREPLTNSEAILWAENPRIGVFTPADYDERLALIGEQGRFVRGVLAYDPVGAAGSALRNWGLQLARAYVDDPLRNQAFFLRVRYWRRTSLPAIMPDPAPCRNRREGCRPLFRYTQVEVWTTGWALLAIAFVVGRLGSSGLPQALWRRRLGWSDPETRAMAAMAAIAAALLVNAAVCGVTSGPFPRYQARVVWLIPAAAVMTEFAVRRRARERRRAMARARPTPPLVLGAG